nr:MAG TPA: hypothetical protein [Caudoviricetes sp.]
MNSDCNTKATTLSRFHLLISLQLSKILTAIILGQTICRGFEFRFAEITVSSSAGRAIEKLTNLVW